MNQRFDEAWRRRALAGDARAIAQLAEAAIEPLYAFCLYRVGRNHDLCEEVVQETMTRAIRQLAQYDPSRSGERVHGWLCGLARNEIRAALRRNLAALSLETLWARIDRDLLGLFGALESEPFGDDLLAREETREMVGATMSQLPPHYARALEAKYVEGRSTADIARAAGATEKAIESLLGRAREAFRATFISLTRNLSLETAL